jgi:hypothetical protein
MFEKYSEGVRSRPVIRFIPFAVTEFGALGSHATDLLNEQANLATASKGMHVGKLLASWRRIKVSLAIHVAHAENVLRGLFTDEDFWRPLLPRLGCLLLPRHSSTAPLMAASVPVLPRAAREAPHAASK